MKNDIPILSFLFTLLLISAILPNFTDTNVDKAHSIATPKMIQHGKT